MIEIQEGHTPIEVFKTKVKLEVNDMGYHSEITEEIRWNLEKFLEILNFTEMVFWTFLI